MTRSKVIKNASLASLFPAAAPAAFLLLFVHVYSVIVGAVLFLFFCAFFVGLTYFLKQFELHTSIFATFFLGGCIPGTIVLILTLLSPARGEAGLVYLFSFLGAFGGAYLGWLNKTS
ncbi:MAG: hypothetical protein AAF431_04740 [Pseudomonadota bacterium]